MVLLLSNLPLCSDIAIAKALSIEIVNAISAAIIERYLPLIEKETEIDIETLTTPGVGIGIGVGVGVGVMILVLP